jgi:hypothetical protein
LVVVVEVGGPPEHGSDAVFGSPFGVVGRVALPPPVLEDVPLLALFDVPKPVVVLGGEGLGVA